MSDYQKYLKYKNKYLELKKIFEMQNGGGKDDDTTQTKSKKANEIKKFNKLSTNKEVYSKIQPRIVVTYQGAFSPIHKGHEEAVNIMYRFLRNKFPTNHITILFMPSNDKEGKVSINQASSQINKTQYMSYDERKTCLETIATKLNLNLNDPNCIIGVSDIEKNLGTQVSRIVTGIDLQTNNYITDTIPKTITPITSKTICTLLKLKEQFDLIDPNTIYFLGIGADNMANIWDWAYSLAVISEYGHGNKAIFGPDPALTVLGPKNNVYFNTILKGEGGILVLDRTFTPGLNVSDLPDSAFLTDVSKPGQPTTLIQKHENFIYDNVYKQINICRTFGWGRTDVPSPTPTQIFTSYGFMKKYLLPAPPGYSSSQIRNSIAGEKQGNPCATLSECVPNEVLNLQVWTNYQNRILERIEERKVIIENTEISQENFNKLSSVQQNLYKQVKIQENPDMFIYIKK